MAPEQGVVLQSPGKDCTVFVVGNDDLPVGLFGGQVRLNRSASPVLHGAGRADSTIVVSTMLISVRRDRA